MIDYPCSWYVCMHVVKFSSGSFVLDSSVHVHDISIIHLAPVIIVSLCCLLEWFLSSHKNYMYIVLSRFTILSRKTQKKQ